MSCNRTMPAVVLYTPLFLYGDLADAQRAFVFWYPQATWICPVLLCLRVFGVAQSRVSLLGVGATAGLGTSVAPMTVDTYC